MSDDVLVRDNVLVTDDGAVRTIRMNRPEKKNALTRAMYAEITRALREADTDDAIRSVILAGAPGVFCAGNDISDFLNTSGGGLDVSGHSFLKTLAGSQKPLVAAVGGLAVGVGVTMLLHCDHVSFPRGLRPCWRRCAWATPARSRCWSWAVRSRPRTQRTPA